MAYQCPTCGAQPIEDCKLPLPQNCRHPKAKRQAVIGDLATIALDHSMVEQAYFAVWRSLNRVPDDYDHDADAAALSALLHALAFSVPRP